MNKFIKSNSKRMKIKYILFISILSFALGHLANMVVGNVLEDNANVYGVQNPYTYKQSLIFCCKAYLS